MVCRSQRKLALRRKIHLLRSLSSFKSLITRSAMTEALYCLRELKLKVETLNKEYMNLKNQIQVSTEVKVEKMEKGFMVRVRCEKGRDLLVTMLETFEEMALDVLRARVSCNDNFFMEATVVEQQQGQSLDVRVIQQAVVKVLESKVDDNGTENPIKA